MRNLARYSTQFLFFRVRFTDQIFSPRKQRRQERIVLLDDEPCNPALFLFIVVSVKGTDMIPARIFQSLEKNGSLVFKVPGDIGHGIFKDVLDVKGSVELSVQLVEILILFQLGIELLLVLVELALRLDQPLYLLRKSLFFLLQLGYFGIDIVFFHGIHRLENLNGLCQATKAKKT